MRNRLLVSEQVLVGVHRTVRRQPNGVVVAVQVRGRPWFLVVGDMVEGVIVGVQSEGLDDVRSFDLRTADGRVRSFGLASLENGAEFPPGHLVEHSVTAEPVRVWYRTEAGIDQAIRLEDATSVVRSPAAS